MLKKKNLKFTIPITALILFFCVFCCAQIAQAANIYVDQGIGSNITNGSYSISNRNNSGSDGNAYTTIRAADAGCEATAGYKYLYVAPVSSGGNDINSGSITSPFATIAHALNHITDSNGGWNIILRGGTYYEHDIFIPQVATGASGAWNTIKSYPGEWAIIDGQKSGVSGKVFMNEWGNECERIRQAEYWIFERLEITGGGAVYDPVPRDNGVEGAAIWWVRGPMQVQYCYIHDNLASDAEENPSGIGGTAWQNVTIKYNYFDNNGSELHGVSGDQGGGNATAGIMAMSCREYYPYDVNWEVRNNEFAYNYIKGYGVDTGIRTKGWTILTTTRNGSDTSRQSNGDKIHHNIIETGIGIVYQQDGVQIYNNIVNQSVNPNTGSNGNEQWSIATRRIRTAGVDTLWPVIYNNTVVNGRDGISDTHDGTSGAYWWAYNNIIDSMSSILYAPVTYGCSAGYCGYTAGALNDAHIYIDRNYSYRNSTTNAVYIGDAAWPTGLYTLSQWESRKPGVDLFVQATQEGGANKLYVGITGANKYITVGTHNLGETGKTIANNGISTIHPYLPGVTIPSYIGATNPNDNNWVAGVLGLATLSNLQNAPSGDPAWIEGKGSSNPYDLNGDGIVNVQDVTICVNMVLADTKNIADLMAVVNEALK